MVKPMALYVLQNTTLSGDMNRSPFQRVRKLDEGTASILDKIHKLREERDEISSPVAQQTKAEREVQVVHRIPMSSPWIIYYRYN